MLTQIAWRNVWRSPIRSLVVVLAVSLGLWAGLFMVSFSMGMSEQRARDQIQTQLSHIQAHNPNYSDEREVTDTLSNGILLLEDAQALPGVVAATGRTLAAGMATSPRKSSGVMISGIMPEQEAATTQIDKKIVEGTYFGNRRNEIIISQRLADMMGLKLRKKMVLTFQGTDGEMTSGAFRIVGLYKTINAKADEANVYIKAKDLQRLIKAPNALHEVAVLAAGKDQVADIQETLKSSHRETLIENWMELSPELRLMAESMDSYLWIFVGIIMLALAFGIINTMLMAVLERTRELGMLMAVGMSKQRIFSMIMLETIFLTMIGVPIGMGSAFGTISHFGRTGIDLSAFAEGMEQVGMSSIIYTALDPSYYPKVLLMVAITAVLSAIYPAIKALNLKPVEAIRAI